MRVLVVDDSAVMRKLVIRCLKMTGLTVSETQMAGNGQEALERLNESTFDLALVDINMPIMNGIELVQNIRGDTPFSKLPIIIVSTEGSETRLAMLRKHSVGFVHKPFTPEDLVSAIEGVMEGGCDATKMDEGTTSSSSPDF